MSYRSILVHLDAGARAPMRLDAALGVADRFDAHLDALFAVFVPQSYGFFTTLGTGSWFDEYWGKREQRRASIEQRYASGIARSGINGNWLPTYANPNVEVPWHARHADLVIAGQADRDNPDAFVEEGFVENLVLSAGRPVLLLPYAGEFQTIGRRVLVGWDGSREAARALHDALPFVATADRTTVMTVNEPGKRIDAHRAGADIALALARHGVAANVDSTTDYSVGDALLAHACDGGYDLLVMGAYGHTRMRELAMGGASRTVLESMTLPVLMSH